ncbi:enolase-phosphatase E1-like isoform X2 [Ptychodera flava]
MGPDSKSDSNKSCPSTDDETTPKTLVGDDILCYNSNNSEWTTKPKYILDQLDKEGCNDLSILEQTLPMESPPAVDMLEDRLERQCNNVTSQKKEQQGERAKKTHKVFKKGVTDEVCDNKKCKDGNIVDYVDKDFPKQKQNNREGTDKNGVSYKITVENPEQPASTLISDNRWSDTEEKKDIEKSLSRIAITETNFGPGVSKLATDIIPLRATQVLRVDDGALLFNQADSNKYEDSKSIRNQLQKLKERMFEMPEKHDSGSEKRQRKSEMDETDGDKEQLRSDRMERSLNDTQTSHDAEYDAITGRCTGTADDDGGTGDETGGDETQGNQMTGRKEEKDAAIQTDLLETEELTLEENKHCSNKGDHKNQDGRRKRNDCNKGELGNKRIKKFTWRLMKFLASLPIDVEKVVNELLELDEEPAKTSPTKAEMTTASEVSRRNAKNKEHDSKYSGNGVIAIEALRDEPEKAQVELMEENSKKLVQNSVTQQNDAKKNLKKSTKTACQKDLKKSGNKPNSNTYEKAAKKASNNLRQRGQSKEVEKAQDSTIQKNGRIQKKKSGRKKKQGKKSDDAKAQRILCEKPEMKKRTNRNKTMRFPGEKTEQTSKGRQTAKINKKGGTGNGGTPATQSTNSGSTSQQRASQGQYSSLPVGNGGAGANGCGDGDEDDDEDGDRRPRRGQGSRREPVDKTISDGETKTDPKSSPTGAVPKILKGRIPVVPSTAAGAATGCTIASSRIRTAHCPLIHHWWHTMSINPVCSCFI